MDMSKYIGEATAYDKKLMLERKEPLSWLKSISAFANTSGGVLLYGVDNDGNFVGLENAERDAEDISEMVKCLMDPVPEFTLPHHDSPLPRSEYAPLFQKVFPRYSKKKKVPFDLSVERLSNLRRNLKDPDVQTMSYLLQPGVAFGEHLLQLFDEAYPGLIP